MSAFLTSRLEDNQSWTEW